MTKRSSFAEMEEADRMLFIAQLHHNMWYDESCFREITRLMTQWKHRDIKEATFYPNFKTETNES
jgi:hypothetical protein